MKIDHMDFKTANGQFGIFGMNIATDRLGKNFIQLFDLEENKGGPKIGENIWNISQRILKEIFGNDKKRNDVSWFFTTSSETTAVQFDELEGKPAKLILSNQRAFQAEQILPYSDKKYEIKNKEKTYSPFQELEGIEYCVIERSADHKETFTVPCDKAKDGVFYCQPEYFEGNSHDDYEYMLVDTEKLIANITKYNPQLMKHAESKFFGMKAEDYLQNNSARHTFKTGDFAISSRNEPDGKKSITMSSGHADMLILIQELNLPYIPIQIHKGTGADNIAAMKEQIGYGPQKNAGLHYKYTYIPGT
jgi:hypothetical protein